MRPSLKDMLALLDQATYEDSYGVDGSDFTCCRICNHESGAGMLARPNWHKPECPVPRLQRKYAGRGQAPRGEQQDTPT